jgi:O-acetyl-ADP-ribose deacetylase (regulator of RNase III)
MGIEREVPVEHIFDHHRENHPILSGVVTARIATLKGVKGKGACQGELCAKCAIQFVLPPDRRRRDSVPRLRVRVEREDNNLTIIEHKGNLLEQVKTGIIVHGCNSLGVMGAGFAEGVRDMYPHVFKAYRSRFETHGLTLGQVVWARALEDASRQPVLAFANAITQDRLASRRGDVVVSYDAIRDAFVTIRKAAEKTGFEVHFPLIGCGLAGGTWDKVSQLIEESLGPTVERHLWRL